MREIKFRGYVIEELTGSQWVTNGYGIAKIKYVDNSPTDYILLTPYGNYVVYKESIGQYTGYKDANGKEIYEGDIIRLEGVDDREIGSTWEHIGKIVYKRGAFFVCYFDYYADGDEELICDAQVEFGTVIGNIYENKNLLEED